MIGLINEKMLSRILTLLHRSWDPPRYKYCWLLFGSEGRGEQTFKTDQDNGIVYCDPEAGKADEVARYFSTFGEQAAYHLMKCGYPSCPDNSMASNPRWCRPLSGWKQQFADWIDGDDYAEQLGAAIFFDFRHGYGTEQLAVDLRDFVMTRSGRNNQIVDALIRHALSLRPPLSFFKHFLVEQNGDHRERFNIKVRGLSPFVDFARVLSLRHSIRQTHTLTRLKRLRAGKVLSGELYETMIDAFEMQMQVRVIHQLSQIEKGIEPDDVIYPEELSDLEKRMLKDGFEVISQMHDILAHTHGASRCAA